MSPSFDDGPATEAAAREHGLEGVVAKRVTSRYRPGVRGPDWLKLRFVHSGDFLVVGWESATARPNDLSSLVLAAYRPSDGGGLSYAGKAGSGLTAQTSRRLQAMLRATDRCPLSERPPLTSGRVVTWVEPNVVVEVEYAEVTEDGRLRHPVFRGIRTDKRAEEATRDA